MSWRHHRDDVADVAGRPDADLDRGEPVVAGEETVETVRDRFDVASMLAVAAGVGLIVIGAVALVRAGIDGSWYEPVVRVVGIDHAPLLGAVEVGVGALLVLAGLAGARVLAAFVAVVAGIGAAIAAIEPDLVDRELALERGWAVVLAVGGVLLALILVMARGRSVERRIEHRPRAA
jgi:lysylphosphatidylglycerol synthetase-like protein (DUF2156 family)